MAYVFKGDDCIANCDTNNATYATFVANAHFIVHAVNAHKMLVEALEAAQRALRDADREANWSSPDTDALIEGALVLARQP